MIVRWKRYFYKGRTKFYLVGFMLAFLMVGLHQQRMGRPTWDLQLIVALLTLPGVWLMSRIVEHRAIGLDGRRLTIDRDQWNLEDVDSVSIGPESVRMTLYRPGRAGTEFSATAKEMDEETWRQVRECCGRIEQEVAQLCKL